MCHIIKETLSGTENVKFFCKLKDLFNTRT